ncbi:glycosyltransferase [Methylomonas sp. EFPC3]|uniref:glycosyltransferase n=1 Tax=Methylomonas sp. EFPC3 TaxID=3021710 RepID=UPI002416F0C2|nr:glycosyltransferase [Methylomonas sp. EFPC3]WFP50967.1 glycosyltransferase [Methylomonas sp. EFPC3]
MNHLQPAKTVTYAFCTYNRAGRLAKLLSAIRSQTCPAPFEILVVNNNSSDQTTEVLEELCALPGIRLRWVTEPEPGIVAARNRCLNEAIDSDILVFIDDDEIPQPGLLEAAYDAIVNEGADCAGGRVFVDFDDLNRPEWLKDELLGFLAETDYGDEPFWISDKQTPLWTANIAYNMRLFRDNPHLRFDKRYDRVGKAVGGGEDVIMFDALLAADCRIRYRPDMVVLHSVEAWRLKRRYFLKLHFVSGYKNAYNQTAEFPRSYFGVPPFLIFKTIKLFSIWLTSALKSREINIRKLMNFTHSSGLIFGYFKRWQQTELDSDNQS